MSADAPAIGDVLAGRYEIVGILGEGGMGSVFEAIQIDLNRPVALKVLHEGAGEGVEVAQRFEREARVTAALHHPGAVKIFDFGRDEAGRRFIVMEKLRGTTLRAFVDPDLPRLSLGRTVDIATQIANVLIAAHRIDLVHRDLKPENIFIETNVDGSDRVVVVDFGLAYIETRPDAARLTQEGVITGTPVYMSPEQCTGGSVGVASDIYTLGCIVYEMVVAEPPFDGASFQLLVKHAFEEPLSPSKRQTDVYVPRVLEDLILDMMSKAPEARPTAEAIVARLGKLATTLGERERARGAELLEGRAARMIPTVRSVERDEPGDTRRPVKRGAAVANPLVIFGDVEQEMEIALRANGLSPLVSSELPLPEGTIAVYAPGASEALLVTLVAFGRPVLTDAASEDAERISRMVGIGVADVVLQPVRSDALASKIQRAVKKAARRAR